MHHFFRIGAGQVDLIDDGNDGEVSLKCQVQVGKCLCLDALGGVDDQQCPFTRGKAARYFVGEVDVSGSIDQVQFVFFIIECRVAHSYGLGFNGDALLSL